MNGTHDCPKCQEAIALLRQEIAQIRLALGLIETPPVFVGVLATRSDPPPPRIGIL